MRSLSRWAVLLFVVATAANVFAICPAAPVIQSPAYDAVVPFGNVPLSWDNVGADTYDVWLRHEGDGYSSPQLTTTSTSANVNVDAGRAIFFKVVAKKTACPDALSAEGHFHTSCPALQPNLLQPSPGDSFRGGAPITFNWNGVPGAASYDLKLTPDNGATWDVFEEFINGTSFTTSEIPAGSWGWMIRANFDGACGPIYSEPSSFLISDCEGVAPQIVTPHNGETVDQPFNLQWSNVDADEYHVFVKKSGSSDPAVEVSSSDRGAVIAGLAAGQYSLVVIANFETCGEMISAPVTVTVRANAEPCPDGTIQLKTPADKAEVSSPVQLSWNAIQGAQFYRVWAEFDDSAPAIIARTTNTEITAGFPRGETTWFVEAVREGCPSVTSDEHTFRVKAADNCANKPAPVLVSPVGTEARPANANSPVTLKWNAAEGAIGYRVWLAEGDQPFADVIITTLLQTTVEVDAGLHKWYVQALFGGCDPVRSSVAFFDVDEGDRCPDTPPTLIAPAQNATVAAAVVFRWSTVAGAQFYRLFASRDGEDPILLGKTDDTQLSRFLIPGTYLWTVEAVFENCPSAFSSRNRFVIARGQNCSNTGPQLSVPANGATLTQNPVTFAWASVNGAVRYGVVATIDGGTETLLGLTESTQLTRRLPFGKVAWRVIAFFANCDPASSTERRFTLQESASCANRPPILLAPEDGSSVPSPLRLAWTEVPRATSYKVWIVASNGQTTLADTVTDARATIVLPTGRYEWFIEATFPECSSTESARSSFIVTPKVACGTPRKPEAQVVGQALSDTEYRVRWTPLPNVGLYEIQESTTLDFGSAQTFKTDDVSMAFDHEVTGTPVQYLYRVRGVSDCSDARGPYSDVVGVFVIAPRTNSSSTEIGSRSQIVQHLFLPGGPTPQPFSVRADKPWITVTPSAGTVPPEGITLAVKADPTVLALGTNTGTLQVSYASFAKGVSTNASTAAIPISISLVTPVTPTGQGTPPPDALIFPVVGHAVGANNSLFESDIRVTNLTANTMKYDVHFTPSGVDGTETGTSSTIELEPNATLALDDIVASLFGTGTTSSAIGMLEVRPITTASTTNGFLSSVTSTALKQLQTVASSRTYNFTPNGTFGQYIPAIPFADFVGRLAENGAANILSLQQVSQSTAYRSNFGFAEAAGEPVELQVRVYDTANTLLSTIGVSLKAREHRQINGMLAQAGINNLTDGRVEVQVTSGDGKVTAYVSAVDNNTNDPLLVNASLLGASTSNRYTVPGMAYINNGAAFWVSDLRVFNSGTSATPATLTFYPQGNPGAAVTREITVNPGEIKVLDNVIGNLFAQGNGAGGAITITTPQNTPLVTTARTYNQTSNGTYGQFIPGVTPEQSAGLNDRALQILQLEQSSRIRTNIGLSETTGQPVTLEVSAIVPDSLATPVVSINLAANEFRQISLADFGFTDAVYNARVTVKVVGGTGKITAYGSAIDLVTQDPTYVPAQ
ncbi:MAG TPA: hypothetical protein VF787_21150 [Thermoanaerobaculia bacterium]